MSVQYPPDPLAHFMLETGPSDPNLVVKEGALLFHSQRDGRFPYLYQVPSHPRVEEMTDKAAIKTSITTEKKVLSYLKKAVHAQVAISATNESGQQV